MASWLYAYAILLDAVLIVCVPFPFGFWSRMWNSIVSVPDHYFVIYFTRSGEFGAHYNVFVPLTQLCPRNRRIFQFM